MWNKLIIYLYVEYKLLEFAKKKKLFQINMHHTCIQIIQFMLISSIYKNIILTRVVKRQCSLPAVTKLK